MSELNSKVGNNDIEQWMTELCIWADKFKVSADVLPHNQADLYLLVLTDINMNCSQLISYMKVLDAYTTSVLDGGNICR